jgi:predicted DNA-binding protein (MmcQ/YjbR family)
MAMGAWPCGSPPPPGAQDAHVRAAPEHFFIPPYVGHRGWLGVILDRGIEWPRVVGLVREAYEKVAPAELAARIGKTPRLAAPARALSPSEVDPLKAPRALAILKRFRKLCLAYPETSESIQFGHPVWKACTKSFAIARPDPGLTLCFWVGVDQQGLLTADPRFRVPPYIGHNGWIALDVAENCDWAEVEALTRQSYRHFALKRMLSQLSPEG